MLLQRLRRLYPQACLVSSVTGEGLDEAEDLAEVVSLATSPAAKGGGNAFDCNGECLHPCVIAVRRNRATDA